MAGATSDVITFAVPCAGATALAAEPGGLHASAVLRGIVAGSVKRSLPVALTRDEGAAEPLQAIVGEDIVVLDVAGGPQLVLHPETARDLLAAQADPAARTRDAARDPGVVSVPTRLEWAARQRTSGLRGAARVSGVGVGLRSVSVLTGAADDAWATATADAVAARVDGQCAHGVRRLSPFALDDPQDPGARVDAIPPAGDAGRILVLVHGTFSTTRETFGRLWTDHPERVAELFRAYGDRVYALDHATLGASPIENALELAKAIPARATVHLLTHSRGGLVAESLARVAADVRDGRAPDTSAFSANGHERSRAALEALHDVMAERRIDIGRVTRVACPARGTLLASRRLDAYVSILRWALELARTPVAPALVEFLACVALRRTEPATLPGLEAQMPDSPLVRWLHASSAAIAGELRVVSGDSQGDSVVSWAKTLAADAFFWTDNDLVVPTSSMYGGGQRLGGSSFFLDRGGAVSHFGYFANEATSDAVVDSLVHDVPQGFSPIGALSAKGRASDGVRAARPDDARRPAVLIVPGVFGSHLTVEGDRVWFAPRLSSSWALLAVGGDASARVQPGGLISTLFAELSSFLMSSHEVIEFDYDWRLGVERAAGLLADRVEAALDARRDARSPVRFLTHSSGALVVRAMEFVRPETWSRLWRDEHARLVMLGPPHRGCWIPMQALSGDDPAVLAVGMSSLPEAAREGRETLATFPGLLELQAGLRDGDGNGLDRRAKWERLATLDAQGSRADDPWFRGEVIEAALAWGIPSDDVLRSARSAQERLDAQLEGRGASRERPLERLHGRLATVVGAATYTPEGFEREPSGQLVYRDAVDAGDGRVTHMSSSLPGVATFRVECGHGELPSRRDAFAAYVDLLETGSTARLRPQLEAPPRPAGVAERAVASVVSRPSRTRTLGAPAFDAKDVFGARAREERGEAAVAGRALEVSVVNGDLGFVTHPILVGHYRSRRLTGAERVVDRFVGGAMREALEAGVYADAPGSHRVFVNRHRLELNPWRAPQPAAVVVVGLGAEGDLRPSALTRTVRQGVLEWARRLSESEGGECPTFELAATLIGSGGVRISPGQSAELLAKGVREANLECWEREWPAVGRLHLIELYRDRATEAWVHLKRLAEAKPGAYALSPAVGIAGGALRRPIAQSYRGADYDFITAATRSSSSGHSSILFTVSSARARSETRAQKAQTTLLASLIAEGASDRNDDPSIGRTLFDLLIPVDLDSVFGGSTDLVLELDRGTAAIPWELIDTGADTPGERPWAIRCKLLRKVRVDASRATVAEADTDAGILIVGEPQCDPESGYARLPGAQAEALEVEQRLLGARDRFERDRIRALVSRSPTEPGWEGPAIIKMLGERPWRVVHVSGHGEPPTRDRAGGVVLSGGARLGPAEIASLRSVPQLVFMNCCHVGAIGQRRLLHEDEAFTLAQFASGIAEELIRMGVRCVIAAGWAVHDEPARVFAGAFYDALLRGQRFIDAVATARERAYALGGNTWAAYQCYGDPDWRLATEGRPHAGEEASLAEEFEAVVEPDALLNALDTERVACEGRSASLGDPSQSWTRRVAARLRYLESAFAPQWGSLGSVAAAFGRAWSAAGKLEEARRWLARALAATDGSAPLRAAEELAAIQSTLAAASVVRGAGSAGADECARAREEIDAAAARLASLIAGEDSVRRRELSAAVERCRALVERHARDQRKERAALAAMRAHRVRAEELALAAQGVGGCEDLLRHRLQRVLADLLVRASRRRRTTFRATDLTALRDGIRRRLRTAPDFETHAMAIQLRLYEAITAGTLDRDAAPVRAAFADLHRHVPARWWWSTVRADVAFVVSTLVRAGDPAHGAVDALLDQLDEYL